MKPLLLAPHDTSPSPHCYVIQHQVQRCVCCHSKHEYSQVFAETMLRSVQMGRPGYVTNWRAVDWTDGHKRLWDLPIKRIEMKPIEVPFCHSCNQPSLAHWPKPPEAVKPQQTLHYPPKPTPTSETGIPKAQSRAKRHTAADLLEMLK